MHRMSQQSCPECGGILFYDISVKRYLCKGCGLFLTKDEIRDLQDKERDKRYNEDDRRKKTREQSEYLDWWLSKKEK